VNKQRRSGNSVNLEAPPFAKKIESKAMETPCALPRKEKKERKRPDGQKERRRNYEWGSGSFA